MKKPLVAVFIVIAMQAMNPEMNPDFSDEIKNKVMRLSNVQLPAICAYNDGPQGFVILHNMSVVLLAAVKQSLVQEVIDGIDAEKLRLRDLCSRAIITKDQLRAAMLGIHELCLKELSDQDLATIFPESKRGRGSLTWC